MGKKSNWFVSQIEEAIADGRILQANKKRSQESPSGVWAQCPESLWSSDFNTNIERFAQNVKRFLPKDKQAHKAWNAVSSADTQDNKRSVRNADHQKVMQALEKENAKLKEDVAELRELVKLQRQVTGGTRFTKTSVEAAARYLKQTAGAKGDTKALKGILNIKI